MSETLRILYEDDALLICCKPVGVLSEAADGKGLPELVSAQLAQAHKRDFVALVHRLDRQVGGVMLLSRRKDVTGRLMTQIQQREAQKEYLAVLRGVPDAPEGEWKDLLFHDSKGNKTYVVTRMRKGVRDAVLHYRVIEKITHEGAALSLVRIRLETGRTHQIRVQCASRGLPLLGDARYGSRDSRCDISLWAYRLALRHPCSGKPICVACLPPQAYPWTLFSSCPATEQ